MKQLCLKKEVIAEIDLLLSDKKSLREDIINKHPMCIFKKVFKDKIKHENGRLRVIEPKVYDEYCALKSLLQQTLFNNLTIEEIVHERKYKMGEKELSPDFIINTNKGFVIVEVTGLLIGLEEAQEASLTKILKEFEESLNQEDRKYFIISRPQSNYRQENFKALKKNFLYNVFMTVGNCLYLSDDFHNKDYYNNFINFIESKPQYRKKLGKLKNFSFLKDKIEQCNSLKERKREFEFFVNNSIRDRYDSYSDFHVYKNDDYFLILKESIIAAVEKKFEKYTQPFQQKDLHKTILLITSDYRKTFELQNEMHDNTYNLQDYICKVVEYLNNSDNPNKNLLSLSFDEIFIKFTSYKSFSIVKNKIWELESANLISFRIHQIRKIWDEKRQEKQSLYECLKPLISFKKEFENLGEHQGQFNCLLQDSFFKNNYYCRKKEEINCLRELSMENQESIKDFIKVVHIPYLEHLKKLDIDKSLKKVLSKFKGNLDKIYDHLSQKNELYNNLFPLYNDKLCNYLEILKIILIVFPNDKVLQSCLDEVIQAAISK